MIHHTCYKCKRRFELDPVLVGFELSKIKKKNPKHYQAVCPACRAGNKVSVKEMQDDLDSVTEEIQKLVAEHDQRKAEARAAKQAKAKEDSKVGQAQEEAKPKRSRSRAKASKG